MTTSVPRRVLVTGAGIAGPTAAYWLSRAGYDVTVLERAPELRTSGQNVDVRGSAREVLRLMGLEDAVRAHGTGEVGTRFVDEHGNTVSELAVDATEGDGPTAELEVLRGDLARLVVEACPDEVTWRFGDHVTAVVEHGDRVEVTLANGGTESYDLLVVAEGPGSPTRSLVLAEDEVRLERLGMFIAYGTIPRTEADDDWWRFLSTTGSRQAHLRPDDRGTIRAMLCFLTDDESTEEQVGGPELAQLPREQQLALIRARYADVGWEVPRILEGMAHDPDLYSEDLTLVHADAWHRGRVALLGDAAWCVTPLGGGGAALALLGGYVLAAYLSQSPDDPASALARYEAWMRPVAEKAQDLPPGTPRIAAPSSRVGVALFRLGSKVLLSRPVSSVASRLGAGPQADGDLPELVSA
jgi:2-polyprenyl-6-methoxyphenol hydroxylase-like FAD-dependent oxidoreductase